MTALALWLATRQVDFSQFAVALRSVNVAWIAAGVPLFLSNHIIRAIRWKLLLRPVTSGQMRTTDVYAYLMVGYAANNVLPMRVGEVVRAYYVAQEEETSTTGVLASIVVERVFDLLGLVFFVVLLTLTMEIPETIQTSLVIVEVVAVSALVGLIAMSFLDNRTTWIRGLLSRILPEVFVDRGMSLIETFVGGLKSVRRRRVVAGVVLLSVIAWLLVFCDAYFYTKAFGFELPFLAAIFLVTVVNLGTMIPSSPGGVGVAHYLVRLALGVWGVAAAPALGFAVVRHGINYLLTTGIGMFCLWYRSLSLRAPFSTRSVGNDTAEPSERRTGS